MRLPEICIRRPVFTTVLSLLLIIVGLISYDRMTLRDFPDISTTEIEVRTSYPGASADLVETQITVPIENTLASINGIDTMRSTSSYGDSRVYIRFKLDANVEDAANDIRDKVAAVRQNLPEDIEPPTVRKTGLGDVELLIFSITDPNKTVLELRDFIVRYLQPELQQLDGVAGVGVWGPGYAMRVWLDPIEMAVRGITSRDVVASINDQNQNTTSGLVRAESRNYSLLADSRINSIEEFNNLIIRKDNNNLVRLGDFADLEVAQSGDEVTQLRVNKQPGAGIRITARASANPLEVGATVLEKIAELRQTLPPTMQLDIVYNMTEYIEQSVNEVYKTVIEAFFLVLLVVVIFLGSLRSASIPIVTIPICIIAVFWPIYLMGYTVNTVTMLALVLAIGLVVDDAIVMLENIHRHIENGLDAFSAAIQGSREIAFAIIAMTITLAAVYAPIAFVPGITGDIFKEFAFALAVAVLISGFVSLTLSPMMCARLLRPSSTSGYNHWLETTFSKLVNRYRATLIKVINSRNSIAVVTLALAVVGFMIYKSMPSELAPTEDTNTIIIQASAPTNSNWDYVDRYAREIEDLLQEIPELQNSLVIVSGSNVTGPSRLVSWSERKRSQQEIINELAPKLAKIPGLTIVPVSPLAFQEGSDTSQIDLVITTTASYLELSEIVANIELQLEELPEFTNIKNSLTMDNQNFRLNINRELANNLGVPISDITHALRTMINGDNISRFTYAGTQYNVRLLMSIENRRDLSMFDKIHVKSASGDMIPLSNLITVTDEVNPVNLAHYNRLRSANLKMNLTENYSVDEAITMLTTIAEKTLPYNYNYSFEGQAKQYLESSGSMAFAFFMALVFIYLVLAAQFESFIDPFVILLSVPLAIVGSLLTLKLAGGSLNIYSNIGFITLIGLVTKHGILITEFANQLRAQGKNINEAIVEAATLRLRPILMTTAAMTIAAIPLALASGAGAAARQQIGWVIVGGLLIGSFFSLFIVPVAYSYLSKYTTHRKYHDVFADK